MKQCLIGVCCIAVCLDGSPPAYHFDKGYGTGVNSWLIQLEVWPDFKILFVVLDSLESSILWWIVWFLGRRMVQQCD